MNKIIILITTLLISLSSQATLLSIELNQDSYQVGDVLTADFIISDIEEDFLGFQKLLASFEFELNWDNSMLEYADVSFGNKLDVDPDPLFASDQFIDVMSDSLGLTEISYAWWEELFLAQDGLNSFVLASVNFNVTGAGAGMLSLTDVAFGDDFGDDFSDVSNMAKAYTVMSGNPVDVPEPTVIVLMLMGLVLLARQRQIN